MQSADTKITMIAFTHLVEQTAAFYRQEAMPVEFRLTPKLAVHFRMLK